MTLTCAVSIPTSGINHSLVFQWEGPGVATTLNATLDEMTASSSLRLGSISPSQAGVYSCSTTFNEIVLSTSVNISVQGRFR